jgi:leucyl/phenylalanyl-tRNA---protein transferase
MLAQKTHDQTLEKNFKIEAMNKRASLQPQPRPAPRRLPWLAAGEDFPAVDAAWGTDDPAPGLLAAGGDLEVATLRDAYTQGIFPWFSEGQPILWWSPEPRMVLRTADFKLHLSLLKTLKQFLNSPRCEIRIDHDFAAVISACAHASRHGLPQGQTSTWILPQMQAAYCALHAAGMAHSLETWVNGELVGGLYCTSIGGAVFGESMFARRTDASKIALAALVALCRTQGVAWIDCQQNTRHLASLGARDMPRAEFCNLAAQAAARPPLVWRLKSVEWNTLDPRLPPQHTS